MSDVEQMMKKLSELGPDFMTVTYGAGGGTRGKTQQLVDYIANELSMLAVAHLTCVGHSRAQIDEILDSLKSRGISRVLALRGDPPKGETSFSAHPEGFANARELTSHIAERGDFEIAVAGYPEPHPEANSAEEALAYLKEKVTAGAGLVMTQLFFDADFYFKFCEDLNKLGLKVPIIPGVMPISNVKQLKRFTAMCGASIPQRITEELSALDSEREVTEYGIKEAERLAAELLDGGAPGVHFYTLNKSKQIQPIVEALKSRGYFAERGSARLAEQG
ncbi:UNVERIFIED_CONTAM: hypothetical protein GTU68_025982 [Idotea baltica]|nr:hypothetical protein [Idotea baltica]